MSKTYIQFSSGFRDRSRYPYPSDFSVGINREVQSSGNINSKTAIDPITDAFPLYIFNVQAIYPIAGAPFTFGVGSTASAPILDPTSTITSIPGWYVGYCLYDSTINETRCITGFDPTTLICTLELPFSSGFAATDTYQLIDISLLNQPPSSPYYPLPPGNQIEIQKLNLQYFDLFRRQNPFIDNYYVGYNAYVYSTGETNLVTGYDLATHTITTENLFQTINPDLNFLLGGRGDLISIRDRIPLFGEQSSVSNLISPNKVQLGAGASNNPDAYIGQFFFMTPVVSDPVLDNPYQYSGPSTTTTNTNYKIQQYLFGINDYDPTTKILTLDRKFDITNYAVADGSMRWFEILPFTRDNYNSLNYSGSMVSVTQAVCYEIELISLILPNVPLNNGPRPSFLSYVYVEISNVGSAERNSSNTIYSNNPNSNKAVFICPIRDIQNPLLSSFVRINGAGMVQTIKFRPNDTLHFRVYLPNGELFVPVPDENPFNIPVNPLIQINGIFSIRRV